MIQRSDVVVYPESDGAPIAENTLQRMWIDRIVGSLRVLYADRPDVFVAGDVFWYPVEGDPKTRLAPDSLVVFGRPPGIRCSYLQWEEGDIAPQVTFEVLSDANTFDEMLAKRMDYQQFGVEEYYEIEPELPSIRGWVRSGDELVEIPSMAGWVSPRMGVRFDARPGSLRLFGPDGREFIDVEQREAISRAAQRDRDSFREARDAALELVASLVAERDALRAERDALAGGQEALREEVNRQAGQIETLASEMAAMREMFRRFGGSPADGGTPG